MSDASGRSPWLSALARLADAVESGADLLHHGVRSRVAGARVLRVAAYRTYGTPRRFHVLGRVLRDAPAGASEADATRWANLLATYKRFETEEIPGARVRVSVAGVTREASSDRDGYFDLAIEPPEPVGPGNHDVVVELLEPRGAEPVIGRTVVQVPAPTARFGIVSDIDDTVIRTDVKELARMARSVLMGNAHTRLPFPGVAAFYRALRDGPDGKCSNPLFYVSSSPWNLYEMLEELFTLRGLPAGPFLLRDWGLSPSGSGGGGHAAHKGAHIRRLFETYPQLPFVLIGDSGQEDPEIYAQVIRDHPGRVLAAYIRSVDRAPARIAALAALRDELHKEGATLVVADDTLSAARHAAEKGWILPAAADDVARDVAKTA